MNIIEYKGLKGTIEYSSEDGCLIGKILNLTDAIIIYEGESVAEITQMFHEAVDDYLEEQAQKKAENFSLYLGKELLDKAKNIASRTGQSLDEFIVSAIKTAISVNS